MTLSLPYNNVPFMLDWKKKSGDLVDQVFRHFGQRLRTFYYQGPPTTLICLWAYGDETLSRAHVFEWYHMFSGEIDSAENDEPAGRPMSVITDQNIAKVRDMIRFPLTSVVKL
ncbi:hypothetical protein TNCV_2329001 [Trichonephila clavipes]|nr:hypothetical protein TNCV_2329001 [Trichonephila clavipes]